MLSFWFKPRQIILVDGQGGRPARNFYLRVFTVFVFLVVLTTVPFTMGAWYAPFHSVQEIIPENLKLKRQNSEILRNLADVQTLNDVKDEQLESLKEQSSVQETEISDLTKQLHMFNSILDERKGKGIQIIANQANWLAGHVIEWQSLFVKGGTYPRYLVGNYKLFAADELGNRFDLNKEKMSYRFESHAIFNHKFEWRDASWQPTQIELIVYNSRNKEVLTQMTPIQGN